MVVWPSGLRRLIQESEDSSPVEFGVLRYRKMQEFESLSNHLSCSLIFFMSIVFLCLSSPTFAKLPAKTRCTKLKISHWEAVTVTWEKITSRKFQQPVHSGCKFQKMFCVTQVASPTPFMTFMLLLSLVQYLKSCDCMKELPYVGHLAFSMVRSV